MPTIPPENRRTSATFPPENQPAVKASASWLICVGTGQTNDPDEGEMRLRLWPEESKTGNDVIGMPLPPGRLRNIRLNMSTQGVITQGTLAVTGPTGGSVIYDLPDLDENEPQDIVSFLTGAEEGLNCTQPVILELQWTGAPDGSAVKASACFEYTAG